MLTANSTLLISHMSKCTRPLDFFLEQILEWGWWSAGGPEGRQGWGEREGNGVPDEPCFTGGPTVSPGCCRLETAGLHGAWVGKQGLGSLGDLQVYLTLFLAQIRTARCPGDMGSLGSHRGLLDSGRRISRDIPVHVAESSCHT